ncbi:hypothetical protein M9Y10_022547 [Tritrichomonas musculus]|uniref:Leucine Rich Repeat family protein n=1 Tax=Tritrichomonas musculus TaxID=1915356 RepID=A0ABR2KSM1_9EUKA
MRTSSTRRYYRPAFEFQRGGPHIRGSAAHKPDLSIAINRPSLQIQQQQQQIILPNTNSHSFRTPKSSRQKLPVTLDMFTIADDCGSLSFKDVKSLNLSSRKLNNVDIDSLKDLISLVKLDVSDNNLKLEPFSCLEKLEDLDFSCNNLTTFSYDSIQNKKDAFSSLRKLNLNYNSIGKSLEYFTNFPNLTVLLLTHNNLTALPKNSNLFYKLEYLDLSYNSLNTDSCFIALAALPNLKTLILDNNNVISIPKFQFGFEKMTSISLKNNKIESSIDIISLADLDCLNEVNILNNPVNIYRKDIQLLQSAYSTSHIKLICSEEPPEKKRAPRKFMNIVRVDDDPLLLPNKELQKRFFPNKKDNNENQQDSIQKSENELTGNEEDFNDDKYEGKKQSQNDADEFDEFGQKKSTQQKVDTDVFMTDFGLIPPTPLPPPSDGEQQDGSDAEIRNIWKEIPVIKEENRKLFTSNSSVEKFNDAFKKLKFIVEHPSIPISTSASGSQTKARINRLQKSASNTNSMNNISFDDNQPSFLPNEDNLPEFNVSSPRYPRPRPNSTRVPYESISATTNQNLNNSANGTLKVPPLNFDGKNNSNNTIRQRRSARANAPTTARKKKKTEGNDEIDIEEKLNSNQQLSKVDVMKILQQMENKLSSAEDIINQEDQDGMNPVDKALDQTNFSTLHKQYESIRSEIVSTLRV